MARWQHHTGTDVNLFGSAEHMIELIDLFIQKINEGKWVHRGIEIEQIFRVSGEIVATTAGLVFRSPNVFNTVPSTCSFERTVLKTLGLPKILKPAVWWQPISPEIEQNWSLG